MFPGFDISEWDGRLVWMWQWSNLRFIGFYLAHIADQTQTSWTPHWHDLKDLGWGILPIWVPFFDKDLNSMATASGSTHGKQAVSRARTANLERGTTIYLDVESALFGRDNQPGFTKYISDWMKTVVAATYTPGIYCSRVDAHMFLTDQTFRALAPAVWPFALPIHTRAQWDDDKHQLAPVLPNGWLVTDKNDDGKWAESSNTVGCQFDWFNADRDRKIFHWPDADGHSGGSRDADWDMAKVFDPAHHRAETCYAVVNDRDSVDTLTVLGVNLTTLEVLSRMANGRFSSGQTLSLKAADIGPTPAPEVDGFDSVSAAGTSRRGGLVDFFLLGQDGFVRTVWRDREQFPKHSWPLNPNELARKGSAISAVSRKTDQIDVFYVARDHRLVTQWWNPSNVDWSRNLFKFDVPLVAGGSNLAVLPSPADASRADSLDVFYVGLDFSEPYVGPPKNQRWKDAWRVVHAGWSSLAGWQVDIIPDLTGIAAATGVAAVRDGAGIVHLVVQNRERTELSHATLPPKSVHWNVERGPGPIPLDGGAPRWWMTLYAIAFSDSLLVFGVLSSGALAWTQLANGNWSNVQSAPMRLAASRPLAFARRGTAAVDIVGVAETGGITGCSLTLGQGGRVDVGSANGLGR